MGSMYMHMSDGGSDERHRELKQKKTKNPGNPTSDPCADDAGMGATARPEANRTNWIKSGGLERKHRNEWEKR